MSHANKVTFFFLSPKNTLGTIPKLVYIEYTYDYKGRVNFTWHSYDIQKLKKHKYDFMSHANKIVNLVKNIWNVVLESTLHTYIVYEWYYKGPTEC